MFRHSSTGKSGIGHGRPSSSGSYSPRRSFSAHPRHSSGSGHGPQRPARRPARRSFGAGGGYAPRRGFGGRGGFSSRGGRGGGRGGERIDVSRFINKAVITETTEHFKPEHHFADFAIDEHLKKNILAKGYFEPTPIQDRSIPHVLRGDDVFGVANTGT